MGGEAKFPLRIRARSLRGALLPAVWSGLDPSPSRVLAESLLFGELRNTAVVNEGLGVVDTTTEELLMLFRTGLGLSAGIDDSQLVSVINQRVNLATALRGGIGTELVTSFNVAPSLIMVMEAIVDDPLTLDGLFTGVPLRTVAVVDALTLLGYGRTVAVLSQLSDAMVLADHFGRVQDVLLNDAASIADSLEIRMTAAETIVAAATFADSLTGLAVITVLVDDEMQVATTLQGLASLLATVTETFELAVGFVWDGEPWLGLSVNASNRAAAEYTGLTFNSLVDFNGTLYAADDNADANGGLYQFEGADDDGDTVHWKLRSGLLDFGKGKVSRLDAAYIATTATGRVVLKMRSSVRNKVTGRITKREDWSELLDTPESEGPLRQGRFKVGRGLNSVFWGYELASIDPSSLGDEIHRLQFHPLVLERRIPK